MKTRVLTVVLALVSALLLTPKPVKASDCEGWLLGQLLCTTDQTKIAADADVAKNAETQRQLADVARINAAKEQAMKQAEAQIEAQRTQGLIGQAQAQAAAKQYQAYMDNWAKVEMEKAGVQKKLIEESFAAHKEALTDMTRLGTDTIREVAVTERNSMNWTGILTVLIILLVAGATFWNSWLTSRRPGPQIVQITGPDYRQLGQPYNQNQIDMQQRKIVQYKDWSE